MSLVNRRSFLASSLLLPTASCNVDRDVSARQERPNILLIVTDDHRWDALGCYGHPFIKTPIIDSLAEKGTVYENAFVTTPICAASRASILTGEYERKHGYTFGKGLLDDSYNLKCFPALLRQNGYQTGMVGKLGVRVNAEFIRQNFDLYTHVPRRSYFSKDSTGSIKHDSELISELAIKDISKFSESGSPFCYTLAFNSPHAAQSSKVDRPFPPPKWADGLYKEIKVPAPKLASDDYTNSLPEFMLASVNRERHAWRWASHEQYERNIKDYYSMISGVDRSIGAVLNALDQLEMFGNTVVIFTSDNGMFLGDRGFAGKWNHFDESIRVPLVIYDPRNLQDENRVQDMVLNLDLFPTILDLAEVESSNIKFQGYSLAGASNPSSNGSRADFLCENLISGRPRNPQWEGVRSRDYSYTRYHIDGIVHELLYDLVRDPNQEFELSSVASYYSALQEMRSLCDLRIREAVA